MAKKTRLMRVDSSLINIYSELEKTGKVKTFPEFTRQIASGIKIKKVELKFFK